MLYKVLKIFFLETPAWFFSERCQILQLRWCSLSSLFRRLYSLLGSCLILAYRATDWRKPATREHFFLKKRSLFKQWMEKFVALLAKRKWPRMNAKITPTFFQRYTLYIKNEVGSFSIVYSLTSLNKNASVLSQVINIWTN